MTVLNLGVATVALVTLAGCSGSESSVPSESEVKIVKTKTKFVCREFDRDANKLAQRIVVLEQTDAQGLKEGKKLKFNLEVYNGANVGSEQSFAGTAQTEDVNFDFNSNDGKAAFHLFLDEADQSTLTLDGNVAVTSFAKATRSVASRSFAPTTTAPATS
jgi:hypothetical protein